MAAIAAICPAMVRATPGGIVITVRVIPRAGRSGIAGTRAGALLVRLAAPPVDGAANEELIELLAATLRVPKRALSLTAGHRGRLKQVHVAGIGEATARAALAGLLSP